MIQFKNVKKIFKDKVVLDIKDLYIPENCIFGLLGKNGAGKTTTIKLINGMLKASEGTIIVNNKDINSYILDIKKEIGYVADKPNIYENLTAIEFIKFMANIYGIENSKSLGNEISNYIKDFELEEKSKQLIKDYSHGTKQKVALIGALIHKPKLLILDEPTVGLDPQSIKKLKNIIKNYKESGGTVLLSTHALEIAEQLCDYVAIINKGQVLLTESIVNIKNSQDLQTSLEDVFIDLTTSK